MVDHVALEALAGLLALEAVGAGTTGPEGGIVVANNTVLDSLSGLSSIERAGVVRIEGNPELKKLSDLGALIEASELVIQDDGLEAMRTIGGRLEISANDRLPNVGALLQLESVGGDFVIVDNPKLDQERAESLLEAIGADQVGGTVDIRDNGS